MRALFAGSSGQCLWPLQLFSTRKPVSLLGLLQGWVTPFPEVAQLQLAGPPLFLHQPYPGKAGPARRWARGICASSPGASLCSPLRAAKHPRVVLP